MSYVPQAFTALTALAPTRRHNAKYVNGLPVPVSRDAIDALFSLASGAAKQLNSWNPVLLEKTLNWSGTFRGITCGISVVLNHDAHVQLARGMRVQLFDSVALQLTPAQLIQEPVFVDGDLVFKWDSGNGPKFTGRWGWASTTVETESIRVSRTGASITFRGWKGWIAKRLVEPSIAFIEPEELATQRFKATITGYGTQEQPEAEAANAKYMTTCLSRGVAAHPDGAEEAVKSALGFFAIWVLQAIVTRILDRYFRTCP